MRTSSPQAASFASVTNGTQSYQVMGDSMVGLPAMEQMLMPRVVDQMIGPKIMVEQFPEAMQAPTFVERAPPSPAPPASPQVSVSGQMLGTTMSRMPVPVLEKVSSVPASPIAGGQFFGTMQTGVPRPPSMPQVVNNGTPRTMTYQVQRPPVPPMQVQIVPPPQATPQMVAMPATVLTHIDNVVTEMERELSEIRAYEQRQEACETRQAHLNEIRRLVAERLLNNGDDEEEIRQAKAEVTRLSILEADHLAVKKQVADLEHQRSTAEREREELLRIRSALELECETRLQELRTAAEAVETETRRAQLAEESANERIILAACEARGLQEQLIEFEAQAERERLRGQEALEAKMSIEGDLQALEGNSRAVLIDCRNLQGKIQLLETERMELRVRITQLESDGEGSGGRIQELELEIAKLNEQIAELEKNHHHAHEHHHKHLKIHVTRVEGLEQEVEGHKMVIAGHEEKNAEMQKLIGEKMAELEKHHHHHHHHTTKIAELEGKIREHEERDGHHHKTHAENKAKHSELEQELLHARGGLDSHAKQHAQLRQKITDFEQQTEDHEAQQATHNRQHQTNRNKIQELERELETVRGDKDAHARQNGLHRNKITEHERAAEEWRLAEEGHHRQHAANKSKIAEMELLLHNSQTTDGTHAKQHHANRSRITDLEQQLSDLQAAHDSHAREKHGLKAKHSELEREFEAMKAAEHGHARKHSHHARTIQELEQRLSEHESVHDDHHKKHAANRSRISTMTQELEEMQNSHGGHERTHATNAQKLADLQARIDELEQLLADKTESERHHKTEHHRHLTRVEELQLTEATASELQEKVRTLMQQLDDERINIRDARAELADAMKQNDELQSDFDMTLRAQDDLRDKLKREYEEKLSQANASIAELREQLKDAGKEKTRKKTITTTETTQQISSAARRSLWGETAIKTRDYSFGLLLPDSSDDFIRKVQTATRTVADALKAADEAHVRCIDSQIKSYIAAMSSGGEGKDGLFEYTHKFELEAERRAANDQVEAAMHELKALREEMEIQHHLSDYDRSEVSSRIELDLLKCQDECALLSKDSPLGDIPPAVLQQLTNAFSDRAASITWEDGYSPMHWAAKTGRRDVMEFLLRLDEGKSLLESRDKYGRAPLYYAQRSKREGLLSWMKEVGATEDIVPIKRPSIARPATTGMSSMPEPYVKVLNQIETHGWASMNWRDGYTMLHWASSKGYSDVCKYLLQLEADPNAMDNQGRKPMDIARSSGHDDVMSVLINASKRQTTLFK